MFLRLMRALLVIWLAAVTIPLSAIAVPDHVAAWAQDHVQTPDYDAWARQAAQIEDIVADGAANDKRLQALRDEVVAWRENFLAAQGTNGPRIATVKDQISALGPVPAEGETEAEDVAARRKELNAKLAELQAPGLQAVEAASRASGIIQSIDKLQRERQASALLHLSPSPLLPTSWAAATRDGWTMTAGLAGEVADRFAQTTAEQWRERLPAILTYLVGALFLLIQGRRWIESLPSRLSDKANESSRDAVAFMASLGQIAIPAIGVYLAARAADLSGLFADWGRPFLMAIPIAGLAMFTGIWLARRFFPALPPAPMEIPDPIRHRARRLGTLLAVALAMHIVQSRTGLPLSGIPSELNPAARTPLKLAEASAGVWHLPVITLGAVLMFRLGAILRRVVGYDSADQTAIRVRITALVGSIMRPLAILVVVLALAGYVSLANGLLWPAIKTVGLLGLLILLQKFITDLYAMVVRDQKLAQSALAPVLIGFMLIVASVPLFAMIWGARGSDLLEAWTRIRQGVSLGGVRLSPGAVMTFLIVFAVGYVITRMTQNAVRTSVLPRTRIDSGGQNAIVSGMGYLGIMLATVFAITSAGIDLSSLAIVAGALSVGIGFGLQNIVSNFISGIILLIERPIAVGDWIRTGSAEGYVQRISVRSTQIQTFDRTDIIVPNSDLITQPVINWTRGSQQGRIIVPVSAAYGSDSRRVAEILMEIAEDQPTVLINPAPAVLFTNFGADGLEFELRAILSDITQGLSVATEIRHQIADRFAAEDIEIPFAHRDITIRNVDELTKLTRPMARRPGGRRPQAVDHATSDDAELDPRIASSTSSGVEMMGEAGEGGGGEHS